MIFLQLFWVFFKIGLLTIGGGYAMIPMITQEVSGRGWLDVEQIVDFIAISESTPGAFAVNISTFVGIETAGFGGALCATFGLVLPSFIIIFIVARIYSTAMKNQYVQGAFAAIQPVVVGLLFVAFINILSQIIFSAASVSEINSLKGINFIGLGIALVIFALSRIFKKLNAIFLIIISAILGVACYGIQTLIV